MALGIQFDADSFSAFNEQLQKFDKIANGVDKNLNKIGKGLSNFEKSIPTNNNFSKFVGEFEKFNKLTSDFRAPDTRSFNSFIGSLEEISQINTKNLGNLGKEFGQIDKAFSRGNFINNREQSKNLRLLVNDFVSIGKTISGLRIDTSNFKETFNSIREVTNLFTQIKTPRFSLTGLFKSFTGGSGVGNLFDGDGIFKQLERFGTVNLTALRTVPETINRFVEVSSIISKAKFDTSGIKRFAVFSKELTQVFTGVQRNNIFSKGAGFLGDIFGGRTAGSTLSRLLGKDGIVGQLGNLEIPDVSKINGLANSFNSFANVFTSIQNIKIDKAKIQSFGDGINTLIKSLSQRRGLGKLFSFTSLFGGGGIFNNSFFSSLQNFGSQAAAFDSFTKGLTKLSTIFRTIDRYQINETNLDSFIKNSGKLIAAGRKLAKQASGGFFSRNIDTTSFEKLAISLRRLSEIEFRNVQPDIKLDLSADFRKFGEEAADALIKAFKSKLEIASPSRLFLRFGGFITQGLSEGIQRGLQGVERLFSGFISGVRGIIRGAKLPFKTLFDFTGVNFALRQLRERFVITFGDIVNIVQNSARSVYQNTLGVAVEFESAFAGVLKTLDTSEIFAEGGQNAVESFEAGLRDGIRDLASSDVSLVSGLEDGFVRLSGIAEGAGQLGVAAEDVLEFTEVIGQLSLATNLSDEAASFGLARFGAITGSEQFEEIGSAIVALGNNFATTESEVVEFAQRIAGAGSTAGLTESQILGFSAAMSSVGINAEAGGTSFTQFINEITKATNEGGGALERLASVSGQTADEFAENYANAPAAAIEDLVTGLNDLNSQERLQFFDDVGIASSRTQDLLNRLANSPEAVSDALEIAAEGFTEFGDSTEEYNALQREAQARSETTASAIARLQNTAKNLGDTVGTILLPAFNNVLSGLTGVISGVDSFIQLNEQAINTLLNSAWNDFAVRIIDIATAFGGLIASSARFASSFFGIGNAANSAFGTVLNIIDGVLSRIDSLTGRINNLSNTLNTLSGGIITPNVSNPLAPNSAGNEQQVNALLNERERIQARILGLQADLNDSSEDYIDYQFEVGDTISEVAEEYGLSYQEILDFNDLTLEDLEGNVSGVKIPIETDGEKATEELTKLQDMLREINQEIENAPQESIIERITAGDPAKTEAINSAIANIKLNLSGIKQQTDLVVSGLGNIVSGNFGQGFDDIAEAARIAKQNIGNIFSEIGNLSGILNQETPTTQGFSDALNNNFQSSGLSGGVTESIVSDLNNIDDNRIAEVLRNNAKGALTLGFGLLTASPLGIAIGVGTLVVSAINGDFDGLGEELNSTDLIDKLENGIKSFFSEENIQTVATNLGSALATSTVLITDAFLNFLQLAINELPAVISGGALLFSGVAETFASEFSKSFGENVGGLDGVVNDFLLNLTGDNIDSAESFSDALSGGFETQSNTQLVSKLIESVVGGDAPQQIGEAVSTAVTNGLNIFIENLPGIITATLSVAGFGAKVVNEFAKSIALEIKSGNFVGALERVIAGGLTLAIGGAAVTSAFTGAGFIATLTAGFSGAFTTVLGAGGLILSTAAKFVAFIAKSINPALLGVAIGVAISKAIEGTVIESTIQNFGAKILGYDSFDALSSDVEENILAAISFITNIPDEVESLVTGIASGIKNFFADVLNEVEILALSAIREVLALADVVEEIPGIDLGIGTKREEIEGDLNAAFFERQILDIGSSVNLDEIGNLALDALLLDLNGVEINEEQIAEQINLAFSNIENLGTLEDALDFRFILDDLSGAGVEIDEAEVERLKGTFAEQIVTGLALGDIDLGDAVSQLGSSGLFGGEEIVDLLGFDENTFANAIKTSFEEQDFGELNQLLLVSDFFDQEALAAQFEEVFVGFNFSEIIDNAFSNADGEVETNTIQTAIDNLFSATDDLNLAAINDDGFVSIGNDIVDGIATGVDENSEEATGSMLDVAESMIEETRNSLESNSPSQVFVRIGNDVIAGLVQGINQSVPDIQSGVGLIREELLKIETDVEKLALSFNTQFLSMIPTLTIFTTSLSISTNIMVLSLRNLFSELGEVIIRFGLLQKEIRKTNETELTLPTIPNVGGGGGDGGGVPGRYFGGDVKAGRLYEVLENNLPFELFNSGGKTYFISGMNGTITSPAASNMVPNNQRPISNNYSNSSSQNVINITAPITVYGGEKVNAAQLSNEIVKQTRQAVQPLTTRLNRSGNL